MSKMLVDVGVAILLYTGIGPNREIILGQRKNAHGAGEWALPGGSIDPGETSWAAAIRELHEETSIKVNARDLRLVNTCVNYFPEQNKEWVTILFACDLTFLGNIILNMEPNKKESWEWFSLNRVPYPLFEPLKHLSETGKLEEIISRL